MSAPGSSSCGLWHDEGVNSSLAGKLLVASPHLIDPNFYRTVVLLLLHDNEDGALGLVINRETSEPAIDYLPEWIDHIVPPGLVHYGGPVEPDVAIGLGHGQGRGTPGVSMVDLSEPPNPESPKVRVFSGYAGWSPGQLEEELTTGSWFVVDGAPDDPFAYPTTLWQQVLRRQEGLLALWSTFPDDPELN